MMQGDFPLYTKRKLEEIYNRFTAKKNAERQAKPAPPRAEQPKPVEQPAVKKEFVKPAEPKPAQPYNNPNRNNQQPFKKKEEPAKPVNEDMLKLLAEKF